MKKLSILFLLSLLFFSACKLDEDVPQDVITPEPKIVINDFSVFEGNDVQLISVPVDLSWAYEREITMAYELQVHDSIPATPGDDFILSSGTVTISPSNERGYIEVEINGDDFLEGNEQFYIQLSNPSRASFARALATVSILNDDDEGGIQIPTEGYTTPTEYPGYTLVWSDEFAGDALNQEDWSYEIGTGNNGWGNNELQYYQEDNTSVQGGYLIIEARQESVGGSDYTSSRLVTLNKQSFEYGRIDIRAALPKGKGIWPALWMLGNKFTSIGWPACGEIDIMELVGDTPNRSYGTCHFGPNPGAHQYVGASTLAPNGGNFNDEFHVFSIIWTENSIKWYVNDVQFHSIDQTTVGSSPYPFNDKFFFIFNVAVGGDWPGSPDGTTLFPQHMIVDYVRVFQQ